ncbi:MAG TPA: tripartite tricarboxylate transporter substrate binding protein [Usitatibacter sp.]|nr:tripartite tricarboxylate transporter substrate binding protein [Usitatibacter sp.]
MSALAVLATFASPFALAQYPNKPIKLIVGFPPGGGSDAAARLTGAALSEKLGQPVVVENKAGANTILATQYVQQQPADGYTLLFVSASFAINPSLYKLPYDPEKDFTQVGLVAVVPLILIASNGVPVKNVNELVALAKSQPGKLTYASFGQGSAAHLAGEMFCAMTGTDIVHVPFKGSGPAITELLGGRVTMMFPGIGSAMPLVKDGKLKGLAVSTAKRVATAPDIPTVAEAGVAGFEIATWESIQAPAGTPPEVVAKLNAAMKEVLASKELRVKLIALGLEPDGTKSRAETAQFVRAEMRKFAKLVKDRNIKVE